MSYRELVADAEPDDIAIDEPNEVQRTILKWYDEYVKKSEAIQASELKKPDEIGTSANAIGNVAAKGGRGDNKTGSSEGTHIGQTRG